MTYKITTAILILMSIGGITPRVLAHPTGQTLEKNVGIYLVDIGYDSFSPQPEVEQPTRFDFRLVNNTNKEFVPFTSTWTKFSLQDQVLFSAPIAKSFGLTGATLTFPQAGQYTLEVTYYNQDKELVSTSFPLAVVSGQDGSSLPSTNSLIMSGGIGMILGILLWHFYLTRKKH